MNHCYRRLMAALTAVVVMLGLATAPAQATTAGCQQVQLPVALAAGQPANLVVVGTLCTPANWAAGPHAVDVLTPGGTYASDYWDWPHDNPALYSLVRKALNAGRATLNYDRIGTGKSSHPLSALVTVPGEAYVLHQLVQWTRASFAEVNTYGHSYGSMITVHEAGTYRDVNRVVVTGMLHLPNIGAGLPVTIGSLYPAALDPAFVGKGLDLGYLTTTPGSRGRLFYDLATSDPNVIRHDEQHKEVVPVGAVNSLPLTYGLPAPLNASDQITADVLIVVGKRDAAFCLLPDALYCDNSSTLRTFEAPYYVGASSLSAVIVPDSGHDLTLHPSADASFAAIDSWVKAH